MTPKIPIGVNVAVINDNKVLLTRREDFEVWCLPGGATEPGESLAQAGIRETREETGLDVQLTRLVGLYSRPNFFDYHVIFAGKPISGKLRCQSGEVIEIGYFGLDELPQDLMHGHRQRAEDALRGISGYVYTDDVQWPDELPRVRGDLYAMRDASDLSRKEFFFKYFEQVGPEHYELEVGGEEL